MVTTFVTSPGRWQKSLASAASVADVVCPGAVACRRRSARRPARLRSLAAVVPGGSRARWHEGARGAVLEHRSDSEERRGPRPDVRARSDSLQSRVGEADATVEERPGAALARAVAGPRSAAREHRRRVRRRVRERRDQALQRPSGASSARPRRFDIAFGYVKRRAEGATRRREGRPRGAKRSGTSAVPGPISALIGKRP